MSKLARSIFCLLILSFWLSAAEGALPPPEEAAASGTEGKFVNGIRLARGTFRPVEMISSLLSASFFQPFSEGDEDQSRHLPARKHHSSSADNSIVVAGGSYVLNREDATTGDVVIVGGTGDIKGTVNGDLVMIGSKVTFSGTVNGDLVVIGSNLRNQPGAIANGDLVSLAAEINDPEQLRVNGEHLSANTLSPAMPFFKESFDNLVHFRPISPGSPISWSIAILLLLLRLLISLFFRKTFPSTDLILRERMVPAFLIGVAVASGAAVLSFLLTVTIVGVIALPFVGLAVFILELFGGAGVACWIGKHVAPKLSDRTYAVYLWVIIGTAVTWVLYCIPVIGFLTTSVYIVLSLGTASIYLFERYRPAHQQLSDSATMKTDRDPASPPAALPLPPSKPVQAANPVKAQFLPRLGANLIDLVILYLLLSSLHFTRVLVPAWIFYRFAMFSWKSATLGEIVLNLHVQKMDGSLLTRDYSTSLIRALASLISLVPLGLGFIWILFNRELESWHDKISGTYVVQLNPGVTHLGADSPPPGH